MRRLLRWLIVLGVLGTAGYYGTVYSKQYLAERNRVSFATVRVDRGPIESIVRSTGEVKPVLSVVVGSFVSGPVVALYCDFNDVVEEGELLAEIDPRLFLARVSGDEASLVTRRAEVQRVEALLQQARNDERRARDLRAESADYISQAEVDRAVFNRMSLEAQLKVAEAGIQQAEATLENSEANLNYTKILSPVSGIVIDRKIDPGQTLASQFQAPELFTIAPRMREKMHVFASVDEADIGLLRRAQEEGRAVQFTVYAYPDEEFTGTIEQIRFSSTSTQNVVTYPVVVSCPNPDLKLLPGMTAELSFSVEERDDVLRVPNSALRFFPDAERVRAEDQSLVSGAGNSSDRKPAAESGSADADETELTADDNAETADLTQPGGDDGATDETRHVWVVDGEQLRAIEIRTGITDGEFTEVVEVIGSRPDDVTTDAAPDDDAVDDDVSDEIDAGTETNDNDDNNDDELTDGTQVVTGVQA